MFHVLSWGTVVPVQNCWVNLSENERKQRNKKGEQVRSKKTTLHNKIATQRASFEPGTFIRRSAIATR
jgi:hypothetical protein